MSSPIPEAPWSLVYDDGNANRFRFWRDSQEEDANFEYRPVTRQESSSGLYSGGAPRRGVLGDLETSELWQRARVLEAELSLHRQARTKGSGALRFETPGASRDLILASGPQLAELEAYLARFRGG